jgi:type IV secretory pathway VirB10-like protein
MPSHRRSRGKVLFEALCGLGLAASFAAAWDQTGASAFLASASITALAAIYWSFGLLSRDRAYQVEEPAAVVAVAPPVEQPTPVVAVAPPVEQPTPVVAVAPQVAVETLRLEEVFARDAEEAFAHEPEVVAEPEPVAKAPKKPRARKAKKAAADAVPIVEQAEPPAYADAAYQGIPLEPLFEPQPFARQPRAFGRKSRGPGTLSAA